VAVSVLYSSAALEQLHAQEEWMAQHGGDLHGYVKRYGSGMDPEHFGDGGELIYEADYQHLERLRRAVKREGG
jgi:hypothetical protein